MFLQAAGNAVKRASDNLVKAAQKAAFDAQDDQAVVVKSKMVGGIAQVSQRARTQHGHKHMHTFRGTGKSFQPHGTICIRVETVVKSSR